jgi:UDP-N-acetylglucosamine diphosphorylase / glucose-1-phosphate thymidylyltransferase / UDP-N-acetylgalactosamine diphosphorylase / glucosamine-1-phosphate N-acetyltransferase / galactosamine-1-phosphate N-acetyltransferase
VISCSDLFDVRRVPLAWRDLFEVAAPWDVLARLDVLTASLQDARGGEIHPTAVIEGPAVIEPGARVGPHAYLIGPVWLMPGAEVGHGAYLRGPVLLGPDARVLHASEVKRSVLLEDARAPHFNYVGDSVLGHGVRLGAGVKLANFRTFGEGIDVDGQPSGLRKLGALLGDGVSIGCNAVLSPGTVVGPGSVIYQNASVRGVVPPGSVVKFKPPLEVTALRGDP